MTDAEKNIRVGDDAQAVIDAALPGATLIFRRGVHYETINKNQSCCYIDKPLTIYISPDATVKCADNQASYLQDIEIIKNQDVSKFITLDDLSARVKSGSTVTSEFTKQLEITVAGTPDQFSYNGGANTAITGGWQDLGDGTEIMFEATTGHALGSIWQITTTATPTYVFRIGDGSTPIDGVRIINDGVIDQNRTNNLQPNKLGFNLSAGILAHGPVTDTTIERGVIRDCDRPIMAYGSHTGTYNLDGTTTGGVSKDIERFDVRGVKCLDCRGAALFGHPEHRGYVKSVDFFHNFVESNVTCIEPNHRCIDYRIAFNRVKSISGNVAIHAWRHSSRGEIMYNRLIESPGIDVTQSNAPSHWTAPQDVKFQDNYNIEDGDFDLGSLSGNYEIEERIYQKPIRASSGTIAKPGLSFSGNSGSGLSNPEGGQVAISVAENQVGLFTNDLFYLNKAFRVEGNAVPADGEGLEVVYTGTLARLTPFDRDGSGDDRFKGLQTNSSYFDVRMFSSQIAKFNKRGVVVGDGDLLDDDTKGTFMLTMENVQSGGSAPTASVSGGASLFASNGKLKMMEDGDSGSYFVVKATSGNVTTGSFTANRKIEVEIDGQVISLLAEA